MRASPAEPASPPAFPWWLLALALCAWLPGVLRGGWALDDRELLFGNPVTDGSLPWTAAFARDYFHHLGDVGQWRPLASLSLRLSRALWGELATGYHLENLALHLAVVALAAQLLRELGAHRGWFLGLFVAFAVHPVLAGSVVWIAGRTSMLGALFPLAGGVALLGLPRRGLPVHLAAAVGALGLLVGLLAKEEALVFAVALPLLAAGRDRRLGRTTIATVAAAVALWWIARGVVLGGLFAGAATPVLAAAPLGERLVAGGDALLEGLRLAVCPFDYPPRYPQGFLLARAEPLSATLAAVLGWTAWLVALLFAARRFLSRRGVLAAAAALSAVSFAPFLQLVPIGEVFAPRFLYLPLLFAAPLVGTVLAPIAVTKRRSFALALGVTLLAGLAICRRGAIFESRQAWREAVLAQAPDDAPSWNDLGLCREEAGDLAGARAAWRRALEEDPGYSRARSNLGRAQLAAGELEAAEATWREALRRGPRNPIVHVNLASLLSRSGRREEALPLYRRATELAPGLAPAWRGLGQAELALGHLARAREALERALELDPADRAARALLEELESGESATPR